MPINPASTSAPTATQLYAGTLSPSGDARCFYCGGQCSSTSSPPASAHLKATFTTRDTVAAGDRVCGGCLAAMDESAAITLPDGLSRTGQKVRCYSWVITSTNRIAATKAHREFLRDACLSPPPPPFVLCLSESGQKHLLYRARVCWSREIITATLETETVTYSPAALAARLDLCKRVVAAIGKPAAAAHPAISQQMKLLQAIGEPSLTNWLDIREQPLTRLALFLSPSMKECQNGCQNRR